MGICVGRESDGNDRKTIQLRVAEETAGSVAMSRCHDRFPSSSQSQLSSDLPTPRCQHQTDDMVEVRGPSSLRAYRDASRHQQTDRLEIPSSRRRFASSRSRIQSPSNCIVAEAVLAEDNSQKIAVKSEESGMETFQTDGSPGISHEGTADEGESPSTPVAKGMRSQNLLNGLSSEKYINCHDSNLDPSTSSSARGPSGNDVLVKDVFAEESSGRDNGDICMAGTNDNSLERCGISELPSASLPTTNDLENGSGRAFPLANVGKNATFASNSSGPPPRKWWQDSTLTERRQCLAQAVATAKQARYQGSAALVSVLAQLFPSPRDAFITLYSKRNGRVSMSEFESSLRNKLYLNCEELTGSKVGRLFREFDVRARHVLDATDFANCHPELWQARQ